MVKELQQGNQGIIGVPKEIAICPECGGTLYVEASEWDVETGVPTKLGLSVGCSGDDEACVKWSGENDNRSFLEVSHRFGQSDWQPVIDTVAAWCGAVRRES